MVEFPNESTSYREARNALLAAELDLRAKVETVAQMRRELPTGGRVEEDYSFLDLDGARIRMSELFDGTKSSLAVYSFMYGPADENPCSLCVSMIDGLNGQAQHIGDWVDLCIVADASFEKLRALKADRQWHNLQILSAAENTYQRDYFGVVDSGGQVPMMNIFEYKDSDIVHFWGSEGFFAQVDGHPRHIDQIWPLWNMLDLTPEGRGTDWYPALEYK